MEVNVIAPLVYSDGETEGEPVTDELIAKVKMAMRGKVLDSFHNGLRAGEARLAVVNRKPSPRAPLHQAVANGQRQRQPVLQQ